MRANINTSNTYFLYSVSAWPYADIDYATHNIHLKNIITEETRNRNSDKNKDYSVY